VLGGALLGARHQREWINLNRRQGGNTGLSVGDGGAERLAGPRAEPVQARSLVEFAAFGHNAADRCHNRCQSIDK